MFKLISDFDWFLAAADLVFAFSPSPFVLAELFFSIEILPLSFAATAHNNRKKEGQPKITVMAEGNPIQFISRFLCSLTFKSLSEAKGLLGMFLGGWVVSGELGGG